MQAREDWGSRRLNCSHRQDTISNQRLSKHQESKQRRFEDEAFELNVKIINKGKSGPQLEKDEDKGLKEKFCLSIYLSNMMGDTLGGASRR